MALDPKVESKDCIKKAFDTCRRQSKKDQFFVVFIDGNGIKKINDTYGHLVGDDVIERLGNILAQSIRDTDRVVRFGGDEFVLFLSNFDKRYVRDFVERIQSKIRSDEFLIRTVGGVGISAGIVGYEEDYHKGLDKVLEEADQLMYAAKINPPHYLVFSDDFIKPPAEQKNSRRDGIYFKRRRSYFSWISAQVLEENPEFNCKLVIEAARNIWRVRGGRVLNDAPSHTIGLVKIVYGNLYQKIMKINLNDNRRYKNKEEQFEAKIQKYFNKK